MGAMLATCRAWNVPASLADSMKSTAPAAKISGFDYLLQPISSLCPTAKVANPATSPLNTVTPTLR